MGIAWDACGKKITVKGVSNLWSVRINGQWRICFLWLEVPPQASNVEIVDYL
jgi:plasmid maintenance system killer protein